VLKNTKIKDSFCTKMQKTSGFCHFLTQKVHFLSVFAGKKAQKRCFKAFLTA
jgi:hypothetical protein